MKARCVLVLTLVSCQSSRNELPHDLEVLQIEMPSSLRIRARKDGRLSIKARHRGCELVNIPADDVRRQAVGCDFRCFVVKAGTQPAPGAPPQSAAIWALRLPPRAQEDDVASRVSWLYDPSWQQLLFGDGPLDAVVRVTIFKTEGTVLAAVAGGGFGSDVLKHSGTQVVACRELRAKLP